MGQEVDLRLLVDLLGKPIEESSAVCMPTASYGHAPRGIGGAYRFITGQAPPLMTGLGWKSLGVLEVAPSSTSRSSRRWIIRDLPENAMAVAEQWAAGLSNAAYAIDDDTAIKVVDGTLEVVSEGHWKLFTPSHVAGRGSIRRRSRRAGH
jgi:hypothetical protein